MTAYALASGGNVYNTAVMVSNGSLEVVFDDTYTVSLEDESFGKVFIVYNDNLQDYIVNAEFRKQGTTNMIMESADGERRVFEITVYRDHYDIKEIEG
ncbi:MAG: hypothetical protein K5774_07670 [Clostridia bacterium]|nr:hypothetical protein [Clostridia bacterium]